MPHPWTGGSGGMGPQGPQGPQGAIGPQGPQGNRGIQARIVWRPLGGGDAITWADVMALLTPGCEIWTDHNSTNLEVPPGAYNMMGAWFNAPGWVSPLVNLQDGVELTDLAGGNCTRLVGNSTTTPHLVFTAAKKVFFWTGDYQGAGSPSSIFNPGSVPMIIVDGGEGTFRVNASGGAGSFLDCINGGTVHWQSVVNEYGLFITNASLISSDNTGTLLIEHDGSVQFGDFPIAPDDWADIQNVPFALPAGQGETAYRPEQSLSGSDGAIYFDTDTGQWIGWDGSGYKVFTTVPP